MSVGHVCILKLKLYIYKKKKKKRCIQKTVIISSFFFHRPELYSLHGGSAAVQEAMREYILEV